MHTHDQQVLAALMELEVYFDPANQTQPPTLNGFWVYPKEEDCIETYCFIAARSDVVVAREVTRRITQEVERWYGHNAGSSSKTIHSFKAWEHADLSIFHHLAVLARSELGLEILEKASTGNYPRQHHLH